MKKLSLLLLLSALLIAACGYRLGGLRNPALKNLSTYSVEMFSNETLYPNIAMQVTTAVADTLQRDGTFRMAAPETCDFVVRGVVGAVSAESLRTNAGDTYLSSELGLTVHVTYTIVNRRSGKVMMSRKVQAQGSYFNDTTGNMQTAQDSALSYAARRAAELIVQNLTLP